ncbi:DUF3100 domain-containing protein [Breoghania sp.]|uniref:DUF3100 domain-containing protein n=1 Tax=Breoghania sp. TaxID=2065378 RepID=UPI00261C7A16|nr:DUF3100 domain-containing protein [Breoghania sp.]MDJ0931518.1 DUF3100 domain-containing protein [Breoghania sp.]
MGVYVIGTLFGTFVFAVLASLLASMGIFNIEALAMACGIGSGSMMAVCTGALANAVPGQQQSILALVGASNVLTYATGLYLSIFVALPVTEKLYAWFGPKAETATAGERSCPIRPTKTFRSRNSPPKK